MKNSTIIRKSKLHKKLIKLYSDKVEDYLKDVYYFQDIEEMSNDEDMNMFSKINFEYFNLGKEFRNFFLRYNISHDHRTESILNDIVKRPIEYILHRKKNDYDETNSEDSDSEDEEIISDILQHSINDTLKHQINNILEEQSISNNLKQLID